jgi:acyl-CoA thioesterase I
MFRFSVALLAFFLAVFPLRAETITLLALGDSLTAGLGLDPAQAFPTRLEAALKAKGHNIVVMNAGVSGDTASQGAARLDWALSDGVDGVLIELGANDALRGLPPEQAEQALDEILSKLKQRKLPVLLLGMKAPPNLGPDYGTKFDAIYPELAAKFGTALYPFYLDGVAADAKLNQADGMHPNAEGVNEIVKRLLPTVETFLSQMK